MGKKISKDDVDVWLKKNEPNYILIEWAGKARDKSTFLNLETQKEFSYSFSQLKNYIKQGRKLGTSTTSEKEVEDWLRENVPNIKLLKWGGKATENSIFRDEERNVEFEYQFRFLKGEWKRNPECIFGATNEEKVAKQKKTCLKRFGETTNLKLEEVKTKIRQTNFEKYGVEYPCQSKEIREKIEQTNLERYGTKIASKNKEVIKKGFETKKKNGTIKIIDNKTLMQLAKEKNCSYSHLLKCCKNYGEEFIENYEKTATSLELQMRLFLENQDITFEEQKYLTSIWDDKKKVYYADFFIPKHNLIIECDGLYWHSDAREGHEINYHKKKKNIYTSLGYDSLFFRGDEIRNKFPIVESIILNKLKKSKRIYARKCEIRDVDKNQAKKFFEQNHLMGNGSGRTYGLYCEGVLLCCMQVRWKTIGKKLLEVSRFCSLLNHSVVGGWSKLISCVRRKEQPNKIITFIDGRYGTGNYLKKFSWQKESENLSFKWTNYFDTHHRMAFPSNSGYERGLVKIWDCGQIKYGINF